MAGPARDKDGGKWLGRPDSHFGLRGFYPEVEFKKKEAVGFITRGLNRRDRLIIILHYCEELTVREIGETWVFQRRGSASFTRGSFSGSGSTWRRS